MCKPYSRTVPFEVTNSSELVLRAPPRSIEPGRGLRHPEVAADWAAVANIAWKRMVYLMIGVNSLFPGSTESEYIF